MGVERIKLVRGLLLMRDAGLIVETITFDKNDDVIDYSATWHGPHPKAAGSSELSAVS